MKSISEKQKVAIYKLAKIAKANIENVESMSSFEASKVIDGLIQNVNRMKGGSNRRYSKPGMNFSSDALAGLAVKIVAQRHDVKTIIGQRQQFRERVRQIYQVFSEARQACLASFF